MPLIHHYNFEQTSGALVDKAGTADSTSVTITNRTANGILGGNAWEFSGTDEVVLPDFSALSEWTTCAWHYHHRPSDGDNDYVYYVGDSNNQIQLRDEGNGNLVAYAGTSGGGNASISTPINSNEWIFSTLTHTSNTFTMYIDGAEIGSTSNTYGSNANAANYIGSVGGGQYFDGLVSMYWLYDHCLPPSDVQLLHDIARYGDYTTSVKTQ